MFKCSMANIFDNVYLENVFQTVAGKSHIYHHHIPVVKETMLPCRESFFVGSLTFIYLIVSRYYIFNSLLSVLLINTLEFSSELGVDMSPQYELGVPMKCNMVVSEPFSCQFFSPTKQSPLAAFIPRGLLLFLEPSWER